MIVNKIIGKQKTKPVRQEPKNLATMKEIITGVNAVLNPGKEPIDWFAPAKDAAAAVHIKDGKYQESLSNTEVIFGGSVSDKEVKNLKVVSYHGNEGGIYVEGAGSDLTVDGAVISLSGDGQGIGGPASGASVKYNGKMTIKNAIINTNGRTRYATAAEEGSVLKVYDSVLYSQGISYGEDIEKPDALMSTPPPPLEIDGNTRTHCTMSNSMSFFYNTKIICDGWAALSTESSEGYVYLEANNCDIICTKSGYGAYADPGCHDFFNNCRFDTSCMAAILAGNSDMTFNNCEADCGSYFGLSHCVNGWAEEVADFTICGGKIRTVKEAILIKSHNARIDMNAADIKSESGVLIHTILNDDPCKTKAGEAPFGVNVILTDMDLEGDLLHEDTERDMWIEMNSTILTGGIMNANITFDKGSKWIATKNSSVSIMNNVDPAQIDAPAGVTIRAKGSVNAEFNLASGGKLLMEEQEI